MQIEYEATFPNIDKNEVREKLKNVGAQLIKPEFLQKRAVFYLPKGHEIDGGWLRVRDEGDKITMSLKVVTDGGIENQKEICLVVNSFAEAILFLESIGCVRKAQGIQESKREIWNLNGVEICIDEWPFLEPFLEVEGESEEVVKKVSEKLGFQYSEALFCAVDELYSRKYGVAKEFINNKIAMVAFNEKNPFKK